MPGKIKHGQSIFIPFRNGMSISDSQNKARMYMSKEKFKASFPYFRLGTEDIELVEYAPVRKGRWQPSKDYPQFICECSICKKRWGHAAILFMNYCPNCGADMRGESK